MSASASRPEPWYAIGITCPLVARRGWFALIMIAFTSRGSNAGNAWRTTAAAPAANGVAIDVPVLATPSTPVPPFAETMLTPGAEMSGLSVPSMTLGPRELRPTAKFSSSGENAGNKRVPVTVP